MTGVAEQERAVPPRYAAAAGQTTTAASTSALGLTAEMLDGGEIIILAVKPSLWFVVFDSIRWLLAGGALLALSMLRSLAIPGLTGRSIAQLACLIMFVRVGISMLRWTSRLYVLTNRRVMRLWGVTRPELVSCGLREITSTAVHVAPYERVFGLGTLCLEAQPPPDGELHWYHVARVEEIHAEVRKAIERANQSAPRV